MWVLTVTSGRCFRPRHGHATSTEVRGRRLHHPQGLLIAVLVAVATCRAAWAQGDNLDPLFGFIRAWREHQQKSAWLPGGYVPGADYNGDGVVDRQDAAAVLEDVLAGPPVISSKAKVIPDDGSVRVTVASPTDLVLQGNVPQLKPGDILVSAVGHGLLRKITTVSSQPDGSVRVGTSAASLAEVICKGSFHVSASPDPHAPIIWEPGVLPQGVKPQELSAGVNLGGIELSTSATGRAMVQILDGRLHFSPSFSIGGRFEGGRLVQFHAIARGAISASATVRFCNPDGSLQARTTVKLCSIPLGAYPQSVGGLPVIIVPCIEFSAGYEIGADTPFKSFEGTFVCSASLTAGAKYSAGQWSPVGEHSRQSDIVIGHADLRSTLWAKVFFEAKLVVYFYDVIGPSIGGQIYEKAVFANVQPMLHPPTYEGSVYLGLQADVGIDVSVLDVLTASWSTTVVGPYQWQVGGFSGYLGPPGPKVFLSADDPYVTPGRATFLRWISVEATRVVSSNFGAADLRGCTTVSPKTTSTYSITVEGPGGQASDSEDVVVGSDELARITVLASISTAGEQGNAEAYAPAVSADGRYVAFQSEASNLVAGDTNRYCDVFVHDLVTRMTERVSVSSLGEQGNYDSVSPSISADGRFVAFASSANNLVPGDRGQQDIFVRDRLTRQTELVSVSSSGQPADGDCWSPSISADGRYVAFCSDARSLGRVLVPEPGVFVHDRFTRTTELVSVSSSGEEANSGCYSPAISANGRFVVFATPADNLAEGLPSIGPQQIFTRDRQNRTTELVSVSSSGEPGNSSSWAPTVSADGRYVAFVSEATNLVPDDTNGLPDIFLRDCLTRTTRRVSVSSSGEEAGGPFGSSEPAISADGRFVAFTSIASNLVPGDTNGYWDVFVHDCLTGRTELVSVSSAGEQGNHSSGSPSISADGRFVAFVSGANNLVRRDTNGLGDIFVNDRNPALGAARSGKTGALPARGRSMFAALLPRLHAAVCRLVFPLA